MQVRLTPVEEMAAVITGVNQRSRPLYIYNTYRTCSVQILDTPVLILDAPPGVTVGLRSVEEMAAVITGVNQRSHTHSHTLSISHTLADTLSLTLSRSDTHSLTHSLSTSGIARSLSIYITYRGHAQ